MATYYEPARDIPIAAEPDVLVVGGGCAGVAAAVASARAGASTLLVERFGFLGGTATACLMNNINGFRNQVEPDATQTVRGIAQEVILELHRMGGLGKSPYPQKEYDIESGQLSYSYCVDPEKLKYVFLKLCAESGVHLLLHTWFSVPILDGARVGGAVVESKSGRLALTAKVTIDASGDADVTARAGAPFWMSGVHEQKILRDNLMYKIGGLGDAEFGSCRYGDASVVWGPGGVFGGNDAFAISEAEMKTRLEVFRHFEELRAKNPSLAGAYVAETPSQLGIRQTRFVEGEYKLTADDAISGRRFADVVAISSCPIISYYGYRRYLEHEGYDIPYRCLVPKKVDGLLVAGRCISSEQQPYESHRAMAPVMAIGQAAGAAAALCAKGGCQPRELSITALQNLLLAQGAELRR